MAERWNRIYLSAFLISEKSGKMDTIIIDKTGLIRELLKTTGIKATLITRPRRFGKTLFF